MRLLGFGPKKLRKQALTDLRSMETHLHNIDLEAAADRRLRAGKGNVRVKRKVEKGGPDGEDTWVTETIKARAPTATTQLAV